ncbi:adenosylcobinamide-GDP ribazoletransferase [Paracoccus marinaquae]|uniref:adenosylcobinamide-GDP ribazoletransferase n=1 Tax=Paracoccus marinaquae TaxID=2841926 RepID=UPI002091B32E|nr:adenosylcobinamide-GDP ribazoletransferase [Paracoccus marinaquae]
MARARERWHQLLLALVFLTRLPLGHLLPARVLPLAGSTWAFPLAGALVGAMAALPLLLPGPPLLPAVLSVAVAVWFTGALHEDGLADFADAAGGRNPEERLRIMRDSRIGSFGAMALILTTALRIAALTVAGPAALIAAAACGRAGSVLAMVALVPARPDGLGRAAGRPSGAALGAALLIAALVCLPAGPAALPAALAGLVAALLLMHRARRRLGGHNGDVLGAVSLGVETAMLTAFALLM